MWAALALTTVMSVSPAEIELKNVRTTYGVLGEQRKDNKVLPGDVLVVAFDITGLKVKEDGRILYSMGIELKEKGKDKPEFKREPQDLEAMNSLGGSSLPAFGLTILGTDTAPGEYTFSITVRDRQVKGSEKVLSQNFEVLPTKLGFVQVNLTSGSGDPVPNVGVPGQRYFLHHCLVGYEVGKDKRSLVNVEIEILDEAGKPTVEKSFKGDVQDDMSKSQTPGLVRFVPYPIELNRPGKFKIVLKATDKLSNKTAETSLNLTVLDVK